MRSKGRWKGLYVRRNSHEPTDHLEVEPFDVTHGSDVITPRLGLTVDGLTKVNDLEYETNSLG